jgi:hypothetical protein
MRRLLLVGALLATACTTPGKVETFEDDGFVEKGKTADSLVGVNDKGQAVINTEKHADVELQSQQMANYSMRERLGWELADLQRCHEDASALGGGAAVPAPPDIDIPDNEPENEKIGLTESGELKVKTQEIYETRLKDERTRGEKLWELLKKAKKLNEACQSELRVARARHGSPAAN